MTAIRTLQAHPSMHPAYMLSTVENVAPTDFVLDDPITESVHAEVMKCAYRRKGESVIETRMSTTIVARMALSASFDRVSVGNTARHIR